MANFWDWLGAGPQPPDDATMSQWARDAAAQRMQGGVYSQNRQDSAAVPFTAQALAGMVPGSGIADMLGVMPDFRGGTQPSFGANVRQGNYSAAGMQALGGAGDIAMLAAAPLGAALKAGKEAMAAGKAAKAAKVPAEPISMPWVSPPILPGDTRISSRLPTAVNAPEDPLKVHLGIGLPEFRASPGYEHNVGLLPLSPGFKRLEGMPADEAVQAAIEQMHGNMNFLWQHTPEVMRQRSPLWYDGAHALADALAQRWGIPRQSASGALAALSPQKDWFQNASNAERAGDILFGPAASQRMTSEMRDKFGAIGTFQKPNNMAIFKAIQGKSLSQLSDPMEMAMWIRLYDEAHNPGMHRSLTPEGMFGPPVLTQSGEPWNRAWNQNGEIAKAVRSLLSKGDMNIISPAMGEANKVRSFYNNIEVPHDTRFGDVTADTHQVAAALMRPLSGTSMEVAHNFGNRLGVADQPPGYRGPSNSSLWGIGGTYPLYAEATRRFAAERGLLPRAGQSPVWETIREVFPESFKNAKNNTLIDNIWRAYDRGEISIDHARRAIIDTAAPSGISPPSWARPGLAVDDPRAGPSYR